MHKLGIDVSKRSFDTCLLSEDSSVVDQSKFDMNQEGFNLLLKVIYDIPNSDLVIALESTGIYHLPLVSFLLEHNFKVAIVNPYLVNNFIKSTTLRKSKTDKKDAKSIAQFIESNLNKVKYLDFELNINLKPLVRERESISRDISKLKTSIKESLFLLFPELPENYNVFTGSLLGLLKEAPGAKKIAHLRKSRLSKILSKLSSNRSQVDVSEVIDLAKKSIGIKSQPHELVLVSQIERLSISQRELAKIDKVLDSFIDDNDNADIDILTSLKGIGKTTALAFKVEVDDINNFQNVKQLTAFIGSDPAIKSSGDSINIRGKITKRGNSHLRRTLWLMTTAVIKFNDKFKSYYEKKRSEGMKYKKAVIATANKLIRLIYSMLKNRTYYQLTR